MLSTYVALGVAFFALILAIYSLAVAVLMQRALPSGRKLAKLRTELGDHAEQIDSLTTQLRRMRSKYSMRLKRQKENDGDTLPDPKVDPDGYKREMRKRLHAGQIAGKV